jgi:hypothetical protein
MGKPTHGSASERALTGTLGGGPAREWACERVRASSERSRPTYSTARTERRPKRNPYPKSGQGIVTVFSWSGSVL